MARKIGFASADVLFLAGFLSLCLMAACDQGDDILAPMAETEREALFSAIGGFVGSQWDGRSLFPDPCGWTPIQGVSCDIFDGLWYVTAINIGPVLDNSLECYREARFTSQLFELKHLKVLSFFKCFSSASQAAATLPQEWQKLSQSLQVLEFRSNDALTGTVPATLGLLSDLRSLVLVENSLAGQLPPELGSLALLQRLSVSGNQISGKIPPLLGDNLGELLILDLSRNSLAGPLPPSIGAMRSLLKLDLSSNQLGGEIPGELGGLRSLTLLDLRNNSFSGAGGAGSLGGLASLHYMFLANNPLGGNLAELGLEKLKNLIALDLSNIGLSGDIPESIASLWRLRFLALDNNNLSGQISRKLGDLPNLAALYLNSNKLTGQLEFSGEFYVRLGRRFAAWNNSGLCYNSEQGKQMIPAGVLECKK